MNGQPHPRRGSSDPAVDEPHAAEFLENMASPFERNEWQPSSPHAESPSGTQSTNPEHLVIDLGLTVELREIDQTPLPDDMVTVPDMATLFGGHASRIGRFEIERGLGMGGHGLVLLARDTLLDRMVALKVPRPDFLLNASMRQRFLAEGRAAGLLMHPNIVTVFESGEIGAVCYLAQDYVAGPSLAQWLNMHPSPVDPKIAATVILQLAEAVSLAHQHQILHRDVKPANILLAPKPMTTNPAGLDDFIPKLADFGIAKSMCAESHTQTGTVVGTPTYMSPEQAAGKSKEIGPASDVYSLGAVLYKLLTREPLFKGENFQESLQQVLYAQLPKPRAKVPGIPRDLESICLKCLCRDPRERYQSAQELIDDLRRFLEGRPVKAGPQSLVVAAAKWSKRNPSVAILSCLIFVCILSALSVSLWLNSLLNESLRVLQERESQLESRTRDLQEKTAALRQRVYADDLGRAAEAYRQGRAAELRQMLEAWQPAPGETDLRSFPWWMLWNRFENSSQVLGTFADGATGGSVAVSPDGKLVASGEPDGVIRLRTLAHGSLVSELKGHGRGAINALHWVSSPDGPLLASSGDDGLVHIWDLDALRPRQILRGHEGDVLVVRFIGADFSALATGGADGVIRIWDRRTGQLRSELKGHTKAVRALVEQRSSAVLFSAAQDEVVLAWDWQAARLHPDYGDGELARPKKQSWARALAISPDETLLIGGYRTGELVGWNIESETPGLGRLRYERILPGGIRSLVWRDEKSLAIGLNDSRLMVNWDAADKQGELEYFPGHEDWILAVDVVKAADKSGLVTISKDGSIRSWPGDRLDPRIRVPGDNKLAFGPQWSESTLLISMKDAVYGIRTPDVHRLFECRPDRVRPSCWSQLSTDGTRLYTATATDGGLNFVCLNPATGEQLWRIPLGSSGPDVGAISPDGKTVYLGLDREVWSVSAETGQRRFIYSHPQPVKALVCRPQTDTVISACSDGAIRHWAAKSGELLRSELAHRNAVQCLALSQDGSLLASSASDLKVRVVDIDRSREIAAIGSQTEPMSLGFVDDGRTLVVHDDRELVFWSVTSQQEILRWPLDEFDRVAVNQEGNQIAIQAGPQIQLLRGHR